MPRRWPALLSLCLAAALARGRVSRAEDPGTPREQVERCLAEVASNDFAVREAARKRLTVLVGRGARDARDADAVREALEARRDDADAEVRRTVRSLLDGMSSRVPPGSSAELAALGRVDVEDEGPLPEVLERFGARWGGRFRLPAFAVALPSKAKAKGPYFEVLRAILSPHGLEVPEGFDEGGAAAVASVADAALPPPPSAAVGPFLLYVDAVSARRSLRSASNSKMSYRLDLRLLWAPGVQVTQYSQPELVRARDARGTAFAAPPSQNVTWGLGMSRRATDLTLTLDPEKPEAEARIEALEVRIRLRVRHAWREARFADLDALPATAAVPPGEGTAAQGKDAGGTVTLEAFGPEGDRPGIHQGTITATVPKGVDAQAVVASVETADGTIRPLYDTSTRIVGSDGVLRLSVRALGLSSENPPRAVRVGWATRDDEGPVSFTLRDVPLR